MFKKTLRRFIPLAVVCAALLLALAGCGSSGGGSAKLADGTVSYSGSDITVTVPEKASNNVLWGYATTGDSVQFVSEEPPSSGDGNHVFKFKASGSGETLVTIDGVNGGTGVAHFTVQVSNGTITSLTASDN